MDVGAEFDGEFFEDGGGEVEVAFCRPEGVGGQSALGGLVGLSGFGNSVAGGYSRDSGLGADGEVAFVHVLADGVEGFGDVGAMGVGVDEAALAGLAAEEVVDGGVKGLALDVP